jgi:hypothetical protein
VRRDFFEVAETLAGGKRRGEAPERIAAPERWGFPLSASARACIDASGLRVGPEALGLAAHGHGHRGALAEARQLQIYSRAVLQHLFQERFPALLQRSFAGRLRVKWRKRYASLPFAAYAREAIRAADAAHPPSAARDWDEVEQHAREAWAEAAAKGSRERLKLFCALRTALAPVVEALVVADRVAFIKEANICGKCEIVPLFDPRISPRNLAIVGWRSRAGLSGTHDEPRA